MGAEGAETAPTRPSGGTERVSAVLGPGNLGSHALLLDGGSIGDLQWKILLK